MSSNTSSTLDHPTTAPPGPDDNMVVDAVSEKPFTHMAHDLYPVDVIVRSSVRLFLTVDTETTQVTFAELEPSAPCNPGGAFS